MLVLKLRRGEVLTIGEAFIQVKGIKEDWVEIGIMAPSDWPISYRGEARDLTVDVSETAA